MLAKIHLVKAMVFLVVMYGCESWTMKKAEHWRLDVLELWCWRRLKSSCNCKIKTVNPKGNQSWIFIRRTDAQAELPIFWPPDAKSQLIRKDPDVGKDWRQEGSTKYESVGWDHWLNGCEFEQALGNVKDREAWSPAVHGVTKSQTLLSDLTTTKTFTSWLLIIKLKTKDKGKCVKTSQRKMMHYI